MTEQAYIAHLVAKAKAAVAEVDAYTQAQTDRMCKVAAKTCWDHAVLLGTTAYQETGMGILPSKINKNRTAADVRSAFSHSGGSLGTSGSVAFQFERKGSIAVEKVIKSEDKKVADRENAVDEDEFMMAVAEAGGDDYEDADEEWIVYTQPSDLMAVKKALEEQGVQVKGAEMTMEATTPATVTANDAKKVMRLVDKLEELEDLQNVYHTMDITEEIAAALDE